MKQEDHEDLFAPWDMFFETLQKQNKTMAQSFFEEMQHHFPVPPTFVGDVFLKAGQALLQNPSQIIKAQEELLGDIHDLWQKTLSSQNEQALDHGADKRFRHPAWQEIPYFLFMKEYYLMMTRWLQKCVAEADGLDPQTNQKVQFYTKQLVEAFSPTNFPFSNPEVLEQAIKTKGASLQKGLEALLEDLESGQWMKMTDPSAFELGKTIAATKGDVVFRNDLFELIRYAPRTEKQYAVPLLIIPSWINKYYVFDLSAPNSFVLWLLEQGYNVFIVSWVNPGPEHGSKTFEDYLTHGAYRAAEVISSLTRSKTLHAVGYCLGGNMVAALGAYLAKVPAPFSLQTITLLATIIDFTKVDDLKAFVDEDYIQHIEKTMEKKGFLEADILKSFFSLLRPGDMVWSFFIKNYLLGQIPPAFDFLHWNADSTRLPATLHTFILRKWFQGNFFMKPGLGGFEVKDISFDLRDITTPAYVLGTLEDHIAPWNSCYPATHLFNGPVRFVLAGSGHVAGVMNPPARNKYAFFENDRFPESPQAWFESATKTDGSWWPAWQKWLALHAAEKIIPQQSYPSLEEAPGSYVR